MHPLTRLFWKKPFLWLIPLIASLPAWMIYQLLLGLGMVPPLLLVQPGYMAVVRDVEAGKLPIGTAWNKRGDPRVAEHTVLLPARYQNIAEQVFAERHPDGEVFVLFETWRCWHGGTLGGGYLYCSRPFNPDELADGYPRGDRACGWRALQIEHVRGPWYRVTRNMD
jgi:hypothetical protein